MQSAYMAKSSAITIRLPDSLKRRLQARAEQQHRSLSSQLVHDLQAVVTESPEYQGAGRFLGLYEGSRTPRDKDIDQVRSLLWGSLRDHSNRND
jgi:plasmid stability protein